MAIYLKLDGVSGSVKTAGYENWIALDSFQWGFAAAYGGHEQHAEVTVREIVVTMKAEKGSPMIVNAGLSRSVLRPAVIKFTTTGKDKVDVFMTYELADCMISHYAIAAPEEGIPVETLSLTFTKITQTYNPRDARLTGSPTSVTYDVKAAQVL